MAKGSAKIWLRGLRSVERGIEAADLRQVGKGSARARMAARLCGWCSGASGSNCRNSLDDLFIQPHRAGIEQPAVDHAMTGGDDVDVGFVVLQPVDQEAHPLRVAEAVGRPLLLAEDDAALVLADEAGGPSPSICPLPSSSGSPHRPAGRPHT